MSSAKFSVVLQPLASRLDGVESRERRVRAAIGILEKSEAFAAVQGLLRQRRDHLHACWKQCRGIRESIVKKSGIIDPDEHN